MSDSQTDSIWGWRGHTSAISQRMKRLLETGERSDVQFEVGQLYGKEQFFRSHNASSDVFDAMFYGKRSQALSPQVSEKTVKLPDILPQAFGIMLRYAYTDVIDDLDLENALPTMYCAQRYGMPVLFDFCSEYIIQNVDKSTCLAVLEAAKILDVDTVVNKCLKIVDTHCSDILRSEDFLGIKSETLLLLFSRETFVVNEEEVYSAAERWASKACETNHLEPTAVNRRRMLGEGLFLIRFPVMDDGQLANGPVTTGLLLKDELFDIYQFKHGRTKPNIPFSGIPRSRPNITLGDQQWIVLNESDDDCEMVARSNAFLDEFGSLHLRLSKLNGRWKGAGIRSVKPLAPGIYGLEVEGKLDLSADSNISFDLQCQSDNVPDKRIAPRKRKSFDGFLMKFTVLQDARLSVILSSNSGNGPSDGKETGITLRSFCLSF